MAKQDHDAGELEEQLADALAQIDSLQAVAADAEARAATAQAELNAVRESHDAAQAQIAEIEAARDSAQVELVQTRADLGEARSQLRDAATRYREARLTAAPQVPHDLVPAVESLDEVDREFEAAQRVVNQLREKMAEESQAAGRAVRVPAGSPVRRPQDLAGLSPTEKIRLGLQERDRR